MMSWVDSFKLPIREIDATYTLSELVMMSWNSRLQSYNMSKRFANNNKPRLETSIDGKATTDPSDNYNPNGVRDLGNSWQLPSGINNGVPIPKTFFDEEGNFDLRRATGPQALAYLRKVGVNISIPLSMN